MADEQDWAKEREADLGRINEMREKKNREIREGRVGGWFPHVRDVVHKVEERLERPHKDAEREHRDEEREHADERREHDDELRERRILVRLVAVLERLADFLEGQGGTGARLHFKLTKQGDTRMSQISIVSIQRVNGQVGVATSAPHGLKAGDSFAIDGASDSTLNSAQGAATVLPDGLDATHFIFNQAGADSQVITGGSLTAPGDGSGGGTVGGGVVGTDSNFALTVQDQSGATQALPAGVTPSVSVTGGDGSATASLSSDNSTVTVKYTAAGDYTIKVSDSSGKVQDGTATETVTAGGGGGGTLKFVLTKQGGAAPAGLRR